MALLLFETAFRFYFVITMAEFLMDYMPTVWGSQFLPACWMPAWKKFHFDSLLFCRRRQREGIFLSEMFLLYSCAAKEELPCDTSKPLLKVPGKKCKPLSREVVFPFIHIFTVKPTRILICLMYASASLNLSLFIVYLLVSCLLP